MPATWRPLPAPVPSPRNQPRRKRTAPVIGGRGCNLIEGLVDDVRTGEMAGMGFAGINDAFELRVGQDPGREQAGRQMRPVRGAGRGDRRHGGRLHEHGRMRLRAGKMDRLQRVGFVETGGETGFARRPFPGLIGELDGVRQRRRAFDERELWVVSAARVESAGRGNMVGGRGDAVAAIGTRGGTRR